MADSVSSADDVASAAANTTEPVSNASSTADMSASGQEKPKSHRKYKTSSNTFCCGVALKKDGRGREPRCSTPPPVLSAIDLMINRKVQGASANIHAYIQKAFNNRLNPGCRSRRRCPSCLLDRVLDRKRPEMPPVIPRPKQMRQMVRPSLNAAIKFQAKLKKARVIARCLDEVVANRQTRPEWLTEYLDETMVAVRNNARIIDRTVWTPVNYATTRSVDREVGEVAAEPVDTAIVNRAAWTPVSSQTTKRADHESREAATEQNKAEATSYRQGSRPTRKMERHQLSPLKTKRADSCDIWINPESATMRRHAHLPSLEPGKCAEGPLNLTPHALAGPHPAAMPAPPVGPQRLIQPVSNNESGSCDSWINPESATMRRHAHLPSLQPGECAEGPLNLTPHAPAEPHPAAMSVPPIGPRRLIQPVSNNNSGSSDVWIKPESATARRRAQLRSLQPPMCAGRCTEGPLNLTPHMPAGPHPAAMRAPPVGPRRLIHPVSNNESGRTEEEVKIFTPKPPAFRKR